MALLRLPTPNLVLENVRLIEPIDPENTGEGWLVEPLEQLNNKTIRELLSSRTMTIRTHHSGNFHTRDDPKAKFFMSGSQVFDLCRLAAESRAVSLQSENNKDSESVRIIELRNRWDRLPSKDRENLITRAISEMRSEISRPHETDFASKNLIRSISNPPAVASGFPAGQDDQTMSPLERPYLRVVRQRSGA